MTEALGLGATLAFGLLSVFLYFRRKRHKRLTFTFNQAELHTRTHPEIKITFRERQVENLSSLRAACWNSGSEEVRWVDIPQNGPPTVAFAKARVLSVAHVGATDDTEFAAEQRDEHSVSLRFAYLNPGDCGFFEVLYEALSHDAPSLQFQGCIIGGRPTDSRYFTGPLAPIESVAAIAWPLAWLLATYLASGPIRRSVSAIPNGFQITLVGAGLVLLLLVGLGACILVVRRYMRRLHDSRVPEMAKEFLTGRSNKALRPTEPAASGAPGVSAGR
jgi:hypothetical protein